MKKLFAMLFVFVVLFAGYSSISTTKPTVSDSNNSEITIGTRLSVSPPKDLTFEGCKDILAAEGLYYATWNKGNCTAYQNSDDETVDLYDIQLYLLTAECNTPKDAEKSSAAWKASAENNYEIASTQNITCNDQEYTFISYQCKNPDNPYEKGVSAFGVHETEAICAELTCVPGITENLETILIDFLNGCHFTK